MNVDEVKSGLRVVTAARLGNTTGMFIKQKYLDARKPGVTGTVCGYVPGHGGDVWWVRHDDGAEAAYMFTEMEPVLETPEEKRHE